MSSPATTAFLAAWRKHNATRVCLLKIVLSAPSALTLRFGTTETHTPDGNSWEAGLTHDSIRSRVGYMETGVILTDTGFRLANRSYAGLSAVRLSDALSAYRFQGATVTTYFWEASLTDWADALQVFSGKVDAIGDVFEEAVQFTCIQDRSWNIALPTLTVDQINYPNAPDANNGIAIPMVTGDHRATAMRSPWSSTYGNRDDMDEAGAGSGVVPLVLVDSGTGAGKVKLVAACHEIMDLTDHASGYSTFIIAGDSLAPLDPASGLTETLGASESSLTIDDDTLFAWYAVKPIDVRTAANSATNPRRAMDSFDETSFATLNQTAGQSVLELILPSIGPLGTIQAVTAHVAFIGNAANTQNIQVRPRDAGDASTGTIVSAVSTGTTPAILSGTWDATYYNTQQWNFSDSGTQASVDIRIDFAGAVANNKASILWALLKVRYKPNQSLVVPGSSQTKVTGRRRSRWDGPFGGGFAPPIFTTFDVPPTYQLDGQFYANLKGAPDDGSGTYTGSAAALIERVPDTARWYLQEWGGVSSVETGATDFGSFVLGRDTMRNAQPSDFKLATHVSQLTNLAEILRRIGEQSLTAYVLDRFTDQWLFHVWKPGAAIDYDRTLAWGDILEMSAGVPSDVGLSQGVRVKYAYDHFKGRTLFEAFLSPNGSSQGKTLPTTRDQRLTVTTGVNDKLDWNAGGGSGTVAETLTAGTYTPMALAAHIRTLMRARTNSGPTMHVTFDFSIVTGYNDVIDFQIGASVYAATLREGEYAAEELAIEASYQMSAEAGQAITVTYTHSTNKFQFGYAGTMTLLGATGTNYLTGALLSLGVNQNLVVVTTGAANIEKYGDRFSLCNKSTATSNFLWGSGTNVATNCAYLLGYAKADTGFTSNNPASYSRGDRERAAEDSASDYGPKAEQVITADWLRDENSATELRNRIFDLNSTPPTFAKIKTLVCPDLQVMRVLQFDSDVDGHVSFPRYGSDGSWGLKAMRVLEVEQSCGPSFHTEALLVES